MTETETKVAKAIRAWEIRDREPKTPSTVERTSDLLHAALQDAAIDGMNPLLISALSDAIKNVRDW